MGSHQHGCCLNGTVEALVDIHHCPEDHHRLYELIQANILYTTLLSRLACQNQLLCQACLQFSDQSMEPVAVHRCARFTHPGDSCPGCTGCLPCPLSSFGPSPKTLPGLCWNHFKPSLVWIFLHGDETCLDRTFCSGLSPSIEL